MNYKELINRVEDWAQDKGLLTDGDPKSQYLKVQEEFAEMVNAFITKDDFEFRDGLGDFQVTLIILLRQLGFSYAEFVEKYTEEREVGIQSVKDNEKMLKIVIYLGYIAEGINKQKENLTIISFENMFKHLFQFSNVWELKDCLRIAYDEISKRKGRMIEGSFVKSEDL